MPCKEDGEEKGQRPRRGDRALKDKLNDKTVGCQNIQERHLRINLTREHNGSYFRLGMGETGKNYPKMCCGCLRPFIS
jgi:hypothetical protein